MTTKSDNLATKAVFAKLTPSMSREQIKRSLIAALEKSGFTIQPSPKQPDEEGGAS
jgi:hypothetical protein